ncbi:MAG: hypothetical protein AB7P17_15780 [Nitrospirales bacterium]
MQISFETINTLAHTVALLSIPFWFLAIVEYVGIWRFWPWVFSLGPCIFRWPGVNVPTDLTAGSYIKTPSAKFYAASATEILFHCRTKGMLGMGTPTTVKGRIRHSSQGAIAEARTLLGFVGFLVCWLLGWLLATGAFFLNPEKVIDDTGLHPLKFGLIGIGMVAFLLLFTVLPERGRARRALREFTEKQAGAKEARQNNQ